MQESETLRKDGGALSNKRPPRILVVDDDSRLRDLLRQFLTNNGFHVSVAENAEQMNRLWLRERFDAVVLDVMMPGEDGISILKRIRASNDTTPILCLPLKEKTSIESWALNWAPTIISRNPTIPANCWPVCMPFCAAESRLILPELRAKKMKSFVSATSLLIWVLANFLKAMKKFRLSTGEFAVLKTFARHPRVPLSRDKLMEMARGREYEAFDRSLDVQVSRLRKIIEPDPSKPRYLQTVWGLGYVFIPDGASDAQDKK